MQNCQWNLSSINSNLSLSFPRRQKLYKYINQDDGRESLTSASPPPPTPPLPQDPAPAPPPEPKEPPATPSPPPLPPGGADHELQDMEIDEDGDKEDGEGITDQLSQFYSEIEVAPEPESREETPDTQTEDDSASVPDDSAPSLQSSEPSSPQQADSPLPNQSRKRKKVPILILFLVKYIIYILGQSLQQFIIEEEGCRINVSQMAENEQLIISVSKLCGHKIMIKIQRLGS